VVDESDCICAGNSVANNPARRTPSLDRNQLEFGIEKNSSMIDQSQNDGLDDFG
jgi:hypothetical protein